MQTIMDLSAVSAKLDEYEKAIERISAKREYWKMEAKPRLIEVLTTIQKSRDLNWFVHILDKTENLEEIHLKFRKSQSGIVEKGENEIKKRIKYGGALIFDQEYNGDVSVYVLYPFIEDCVDRVKDKYLDRVPPEGLTSKYIETQVIEFLDEIIDWEDSNTKNAIGFKWDGL